MSRPASARPISATLAALLLASTLGCEGDPAPTGSGDAPDEGPGRLVIVGGALDADNAPVHHAVLEAREGEGPFCVVPTASGAPRESMGRAIETFRRYAADPAHAADSLDVVGLWITTDNPEAASDPEVVRRLSTCSGFWFVGGSQSRIVHTFRPADGDTPAYQVLMRRWEEGAVVAGTSAGAAMMSARSIAGGSPDEALASGVARDADGDGEADGEGVWVLPGMDLVTWGIVGQHHLARGRWGRLVVGVLEEEDDLGVGIDENTALVVEDGAGRVVGASSVLLVDASDAGIGTEPRTARGIRLELLAAGDRLELDTGGVTRPGGRASVPSLGAPPADSAAEAGPWALDELTSEPFARWAFLRLAQRMAAGDADEVALDGGARTLRLRTGEGFTAGVDPEGGLLEEAGTARGLSAGPFLLDLEMPGG